MKAKWNNEKLAELYDSVIAKANDGGNHKVGTDMPTLTSLTSSDETVQGIFSRVSNLIELAYFCGQLSGIAMADEIGMADNIGMADKIGAKETAEASEPAKAADTGAETARYAPKPYLDKKYYAIVGGRTGLIIGATEGSSVKNVIDEEGCDISFIPLSEEEYDSYDSWCGGGFEYYNIKKRTHLTAREVAVRL